MNLYELSHSLEAMRNLAFASIQFVFGLSHVGLENKLEGLLIVAETPCHFPAIINSRSLKYLSPY